MPYRSPLKLYTFTVQKNKNAKALLKKRLTFLLTTKDIEYLLQLLELRLNKIIPYSSKYFLVSLSTVKTIPFMFSYKIKFSSS